MPTDEELLAAWRGGDPRAGGQLFARHFRTVRIYFANKVDDQVEAEELIQATFAACVEARDRFELQASFRAYLLGIARHLLYRHWQQRARRAKVAIEDLSLADLGAGPSSVLSDTEQDRRLLQALRQLPLPQQEVLELYYWEELGGRGLGEVLGVGEETARSRLRRAKIALRKELNRLERFAGAPPSTEHDLEDWARAIRGALEPVG